uniref:DUF223 domain-containing protein n=1 Tax=Brassica oleracea var. oleracea TaxID=109376 RepID=A0A0D2ZT57_BRAOL
MSISRVFFSDLKSGKCSSVVEARLLRFWEARNVKRGGELMWVDMLLMDVNVSLILPVLLRSVYVLPVLPRSVYVRFLISKSYLFQWTLMQATINANRLPKFRDRLAAGTIYSVSSFDVARCAQNFKLADSSLMIRFSDSTEFDELSDPVSPIPAEGFRFRNQTELVGLANTNTQLPATEPLIKVLNTVDIIGEIVTVKSTVSDPPEDKNCVMVTVKLE